MISPPWLNRTCAFLLIPLFALVAACSGVTGGASPTPTPTQTPVPTICAQLRGFASATALTLPNTEFPTGTVATAPTASFGGDGQFTLNDYAACTPNNTTDLTVNSGKGPKPFASLILIYAWQSSTTFPFDGAFPTSCASGATCFSYVVDTERYLELKDLKDNGNGLITYHIIHATPPAAPKCTPAPFTDPNNPMPLTITFSGYSSPGIFLPPMTRSIGFDGHTGQITYSFCSAGSAASINTFLAKAIPAAGWSAGNGPYPANVHSCVWHLTDTTKQITFCINAVGAGDPKDWVINTSAPM